MNCKKCNAELPPDKMFCPNCGFLNQQPTSKFFKEPEVLPENVLKTQSLEDLPDWYRLYEGKLISGVFSGLSSKWEINPYILRVASIIVPLLFLPVGIIEIIFYVILSFKLPLVHLSVDKK